MKHWLGEGSGGQDNLFMDLDPYLYLIDQAICHKVTQHAYRFEEKPMAIIVPPSGIIPWHMAYLSKQFHVLVWTEDNNEMLEEAAATFDVDLFSGEVPTDIAAVQLFLFLDTRWENETMLMLELHDVSEHLADNGVALFAIRTTGENGTGEIRWADGSYSPTAEFLSVNGFSLTSEITAFPVRDLTVNREERMNTFLQHHREFFGRNAREFCLSRLKDAEFRDVERGDGWVSVVSLRR